jgi:hypothetical protein
VESEPAAYSLEGIESATGVAHSKSFSKVSPAWFVGERSAGQQVALTLERERSAIDGSGDCEHSIQVIQFVLQKLGASPFEETSMLDPVFIAESHRNGRMTLHANQQVREAHAIVPDLDHFRAERLHNGVEEEPGFIEMHVNNSLEHTNLRGSNSPAPAMSMAEVHHGIVQVLPDWPHVAQFRFLNRLRCRVELWIT